MAQKHFVIVVEDDPVLGPLCAEILQYAIDNLLIELIKDGQIAYDRFLDSNLPKKPDVILLDLHLPNVSGAELLQTIKANPELSDIPIIILSADASLASTLASQVTSVLIKPFSYDTLSKRVGALLPPDQ